MIIGASSRFESSGGQHVVKGLAGRARHGNFASVDLPECADLEDLVVAVPLGPALDQLAFGLVLRGVQRALDIAERHSHDSVVLSGPDDVTKDARPSVERCLFGGNYAGDVLSVATGESVFLGVGEICPKFEATQAPIKPNTTWPRSRHHVWRFSSIHTVQQQN